MGTYASSCHLGHCQKHEECPAYVANAVKADDIRVCWSEKADMAWKSRDVEISEDYFGMMGPAWQSDLLPQTPLFKPGALVRVHHCASAGSRSPRNVRPEPSKSIASRDTAPSTDSASSASSLGRLGIRDVYNLRARPLGSGSFGEVSVAKHRRTGVERAIKVVNKAAVRKHGVTDVEGFIRREVESLRRMDHPHVVRLYEAFEDSRDLYLVLELCEGGDLRDALLKVKKVMPEDVSCSLMVQMCVATQHAHRRGFVHRDLKPENFLLKRKWPCPERPHDAGAAHVKLADFGLSWVLGSTGVAKSRSGTLQYMAPETKDNTGAGHMVDRTDVWALGVILHVLFTGRYLPKCAAKEDEATGQQACAVTCEGGPYERISPSGKDLLKKLLALDPSARPTVSATLEHPWFQQALESPASALTLDFNLTVRAFRTAPALQKLALAAVAREVEDEDVGCARQLFQLLEVECGGTLTCPSLLKAHERPSRSGVVGKLIKELLTSFEDIDVDGSGAIDWTEFLAVILSSAGAIMQKLSRDPEEDAGTDFNAHTQVGGFDQRSGIAAPALREDACWRAFDMLSCGEGALTSGSLMEALAAEDPGTSPQRSTRPNNSSAAAFDRMMLDVDNSGEVSSSLFLRLLVNGKRQSVSEAALSKGTSRTGPAAAVEEWCKDEHFFAAHESHHVPRLSQELRWRPQRYGA